MAKTSPKSRKSPHKPAPPPPEPPPAADNPADIAETTVEYEDDTTQEPLDAESAAGGPPAVTETEDTAAGKPTVWDAMMTFTQSEWDNGNAMSYLYRLQPYTDRSSGGNTPHFVQKYTSPVDIEYIMKTEGSGKYRLMLNYAAPGETKGKCVSAGIFRILNPKYPPVIPAGEWLDDPRNKPWLWAKPSATAAPGQQTPGQPAGQAAPPLDAVQAYERISASVDRRLNQFAQQQAQHQPANPLVGMAPILEVMQKASNPAVMIETLRGIRDLTGTGGSNNNDLLMKFLMDDRAAMREEIREMRQALTQRQAPAANEKPKGLIDQLKEMTESQGLVKNLAKAFSGEAPTQGWGDVLPGLAADAAREVLPSLPFIIQGLFNRPQAAAATPAGVQQMPNLTPVPRPQTAAAAGAPGELPIQAYLRILQEVQGTMVRYINNGASGADFADWFEGTYGPVIYGQVRSIGAQKILMAFKMSPIWSDLAPVEPQVTRFLDEFTTWEAPPEEEAEEQPADEAEMEIEDLTRTATA